MTISEKAAYLKGLMDGVSLDTEKPEGKVIAAMVELIGDMAKRLADVEDTTIAISDELDAIEEDLDAIEDYILDEDYDDFEDYDDEDEDFFDDEDVYHFGGDDEDDDEDEGFEEGFDFGDEESIIYEVTCACGNLIDFDEATLEAGSIICSNCGEILEFTTEDIEYTDEEE